MDDKTLVERLDTAIKDDHERGCQGRYYSCTCGYDNDCSQAMQDAKSRIEVLEAALRETMSRCADCGGRGSFVKHDEVTDRDLWESCASCAVGYAALESQP